jgi:membrane carboxypeptidase/penicillin-binding protein PbpC
VLSADPALSEWRAVDTIDPRLLAAVVLAEDRLFWSHRGVDTSAVWAAARKNIQARRVRFGASTIPMQVARMLYGWSGTTMRRKLGESIVAMWLIARYDRITVLEVYINLVPVMAGTRGLATGTRALVGVDAADLNAFDCTFVAASLSVCPPTRPVGDEFWIGWLRESQRRLIRRMEASGRLDPEEASAALDLLHARFPVERPAP